MAQRNTPKPRSVQAAPALATFKQRDAWMRDVLADSALSHATRMVAVRLALYVYLKTGRCNPSYGELGKALGCDRRTTIRAVAELVKRGWLVKSDSKGWYSNNFRPRW